MNNHLNKAEYEELAEFRYRLRKFLHFSDTKAREVGITPTQHQLLLAIQGFPGRDYATPTEIAERLQLRSHSCLGLIQRCEQSGLVERFDNPSDKRSIYIRLSPRGLDMLQNLTASHQIELNRLGLSYQQVLLHIDDHH